MISLYGTFLLFESCCIIGLLYFLIFLHDTTRKSANQIAIEYEGEKNAFSTPLSQIYYFFNVFFYIFYKVKYFFKIEGRIIKKLK